MNSLDFRLVSSDYKCFEDMPADNFAVLSRATVLKNDAFAFEAVITAPESMNESEAYIIINSPIAGYVKTYLISGVNVTLGVYENIQDTDYLRGGKPGIYPDLLTPLDKNTAFKIKAGKTASVWIEAEIPESLREGVYPIEVSVRPANGEFKEEKRALELEVIPAVLPEQKLIFTQWFHCDCLASYYNVEVFSEEHWRIIENFVKTAVKNGINMLLMPVFTPPLDTEVGGERPTVQLVGVTKDGARYSFDYTLADRWIDMCRRCSVQYYEVSHLFTQWGAAHAPKVMAYENGVYKKIFGWETDSLSDEYLDFIRQFLESFKKYMSEKGLLDKTMFHLSDEPSKEHLERYGKLRQSLEKSLDGCMCADALSNFEFYESGAVKHPIVATDHIEPFIQNGVKDLWCYYCCGQSEKVANRFIAMSMNRTRIIGAQLFKFDIRGFLHWGYNFYYTQFSKAKLDPYKCNDGGGWVPAGDTFSVYPAPDGTAYESLHMKGFTQALYDLRAFELLASLTSREYVIDLIDSTAGENVTFSEYPRYDGFCRQLREAINEHIKGKIAHGFAAKRRCNTRG